MALAPEPRPRQDRAPAWYLHRKDATVLAGPFAGEAAALTARVRLAERLGDSMRRGGGPCSAADIEACVAKVLVGYGVRPEPHRRFIAVPRDAA